MDDLSQCPGVGSLRGLGEEAELIAGSMLAARGGKSGSPVSSHTTLPSLPGLACCPSLWAPGTWGRSETLVGRLPVARRS